MIYYSIHALMETNAFWYFRFIAMDFDCVSLLYSV